MRSVIAGLTVVTRQHTAAPPPAGVVVLCHGFGAPGTDLVGLAESLVAIEPSLSSVRFHFPAAPLSLDHLGYGDSKAWWMIDFEVIEKLRQGGPEALSAFRKVEPDGMATARKAMLALVAEVMNSSGLPYSKLVLGGFSQGSMITTDVALRLEEAPAGLAVLSGTLLTEDVWSTKAKARSGLHVFQSHGRFDQVLPFSGAQSLEKVLTSAGMAVEFLEFAGGHEIPANVLRNLARFICDRLALP
jgi:phospholipase/carboxylesterase